MTYHITGLISAVIFLLTASGLWLQLQFVWKRKRAFHAGTGQRPTAVLSLNQFVSSFLAFYSFFLYGGCLPRFNHYLVWTRLVASVRGRCRVAAVGSSLGSTRVALDAGASPLRPRRRASASSPAASKR